MADEIHHHVDLSPIVAAVVAVLVEPYNDFLGRLEDAGRVTTAEVEALRAAVLARGDRLGELVQERLRMSAASDPTKS